MFRSKKTFFIPAYLRIEILDIKEIESSKLTTEFMANIELDITITDLQMQYVNIMK